MALKEMKKINILVEPMFLQDQSVIAQYLYFWAYTVTIKNNSPEAVQLLFRYWKIIDANGDITVAEGEGVVGEKPVIVSGEQYQYTSGTYMKTPSGVMMGEYAMVSLKTKKQFIVPIPIFSLDSPYEHKIKS
jgi:ApaG protein